jgi:four helix bundle protein
MPDYRKLDVYHDARRLGRDLFRVTSRLPLYLRWRLGGQLDDAVDSIGSNLAEGCGRKSPEQVNTELIRYARLAYGSACEVEHRIAALHDRQLISDSSFSHLNDHIGMIKGKLMSLIEVWRRDDRGKLR